MGKPGKYAHVTPHLKKIYGTTPDRQDKIDEIKIAILADETVGASSLLMAKEYLRLRAEKDELKMKLYNVEMALDAVTQLLSDRFAAEGVESLKIDGQPIYYRLVPYANISEPEAFRQWCLKNPDLARKMQIPWATMNKLAGDMLAAGEEPPPGVSVYAKPHFTRGSE